jgi:hypothetical protein
VSNTPAIQCESPDGDISMAITAKWQEAPLEGEGADKFLWIMSQPDRGITITVYKPQNVPVNNLSMIKDYAVKDAEKKGYRKENEAPAKMGGLDAIRVQFSDNGGSTRYLYITVKDKKAFVFIGELKDVSQLPEIEEVQSTVQIK